MPAGRPTDYTPELAERICAWLAGGKSLRAFCRQDDTPAIETVCRWVVRHDEFRQQYTQAREAAGYAHGDGVVEVVELLREGEIDPHTAKAMMDGLKWSAERMAPKAHMPQSLINHESPQGTMTPQPGIDVSKLSPEAMREILDAAKPD